MIESIKATNFQSLQDVDLEFGKLTVIVGASSSGKSALTRAMKAVTSNALDSDNITRGTKEAAVTLRTDEASVTIERKAGGSSVYKIAKQTGEESPYSKLNRQVPTQVTEALGILPSTQEVASINFAGQFDTPYLLKEGASAVARILGELTNVSTIFAAVREASKRAKNASTLVNLRKKDRDRLVAQLADYVEIGQQAKSVSAAEEKLVECTRLEMEISQLSDLTERATIASKALGAIKEIPELPDLGNLLEAQTKLNSFKLVLRELALARRSVSEQEELATKAEQSIVLAETELHDTLVAAGKCPTCNQDVH